MVKHLLIIIIRYQDESESHLFRSFATSSSSGKIKNIISIIMDFYFYTSIIRIGTKFNIFPHIKILTIISNIGFMIVHTGLGAFILEPVSERIMADICNNNYINMSCLPLSRVHVLK